MVFAKSGFRVTLQTVSGLVRLGCCNKNTVDWGLSPHTLFLKILETRKPKVRVQVDSVSDDSPLSVSLTAVVCSLTRVLTWQQREGARWCLFYKGHKSHPSGLHPHDLVTVQSPTSRYITLGIRCQHMSFGEARDTSIQSVAIITSSNEN